MKKNIPGILTQLTEVLDFELKAHHIKFFGTSSELGGAMGSQSRVIFEKKNRSFSSFEPPKNGVGSRSQG